jgi:hypothetical protein
MPQENGRFDRREISRGGSGPSGDLSDVYSSSSHAGAGRAARTVHDNRE